MGSVVGADRYSYRTSSANQCVTSCPVYISCLEPANDWRSFARSHPWWPEYPLIWFADSMCSKKNPHIQCAPMESCSMYVHTYICMYVHHPKQWRFSGSELVSHDVRGPRYGRPLCMQAIKAWPALHAHAAAAAAASPGSPLELVNVRRPCLDWG